MKQCMSYQTNNDNIYKEGSVITAKVNPEQKLIITKYYQRIYYCAIATKPEAKQFAYFERELIAPVPDSPVKEKLVL